MAHIMTIGLTAPHRIKDLAQLFMSKDKPAYPDFLKKIHNWGAGTVDGKYRSIAVYEFPEEKLLESLIALTSRYNFYASKGDYTFEVIPLISQEDAMKIAFAK